MGCPLPFVCETYLSFVSGVERGDVEQVVNDAIERAQKKHSDFDRFLPGVHFLSSVVFCAHDKIPIDDYLETLYCAVKHGDYTRSWRTQLRAKKETPAVSTSNEPAI